MRRPAAWRDGPLPIRRVPEGWRSGFVQAGVAALADRGVAEKADQNGPWRTASFAQKGRSTRGFRRVSTSLGWLTPEVRRRPNLTILTGVGVRRIGFDEGRAAGVFAAIGEQETFIGAREIILCAGALQSPPCSCAAASGPALTCRSAPSKSCAIAPASAAPDGASLCGLAFHLPRGSRTGEEHHHIPRDLALSSGHEGCAPGDMHMGLMGPIGLACGRTTARRPRLLG